MINIILILATITFVAFVVVAIVAFIQINRNKNASFQKEAVGRNYVVYKMDKRSQEMDLIDISMFRERGIAQSDSLLVTRYMISKNATLSKKKKESIERKSHFEMDYA